MFGKHHHKMIRTGIRLTLPPETAKKLTKIYKTIFKTLDIRQ